MVYYPMKQEDRGLFDYHFDIDYDVGVGFFY